MRQRAMHRDDEGASPGASCIVAPCPYSKQAGAKIRRRTRPSHASFGQLLLRIRMPSHQGERTRAERALIQRNMVERGKGTRPVDHRPHIAAFARRLICQCVCFSFFLRLFFLLPLPRPAPGGRRGKKQENNRRSAPHVQGAWQFNHHDSSSPAFRAPPSRRPPPPPFFFPPPGPGENDEGGEEQSDKNDEGERVGGMCM